MKTDAQGKSFLQLIDQKPGDHKVKVTFNQTDKYNGCSAEKTIKIEENGTNTSASSAAETTSSTNQSSSSGSSSSGTTLYYDADLNVYYDSNGKVIGGQSDGASIYELRENSKAMDRAQEETGRYDESL